MTNRVTEDFAQEARAVLEQVSQESVQVGGKDGSGRSSRRGSGVHCALSTFSSCISNKGAPQEGKDRREHGRRMGTCDKRPLVSSLGFFSMKEESCFGTELT